MLEVRRYTATPGNAKALADRFTQRTLPLLRELGFELLGIGSGTEDPHLITYILRWEDQTAMDRGWQQFTAHPEWAAIKRDTEPDGPLYLTIDKLFLAELA
jgi:heme-degrading monooxygenase HmoA